MVFGRESARQEARILFRRAVADEERPDHVDVEDHRQGRPGGGALLVEDIHLLQSPTGAAIFLRPAGRGPAFGQQDPVPTVGKLAIERQARQHAALNLLGQALLEKGAHFAAEGAVFRCIECFHRAL